MRKEPVESRFVNSKARDWSRRCPVDAAPQENQEKVVDWNAPRRGPVKSKFESSTRKQRAMSTKRAPVAADASKENKHMNWSGTPHGSGIDLVVEVPKNVGEQSDSVKSFGGSCLNTSIDWPNRGIPIKDHAEKVTEWAAELVVESSVESVATSDAEGVLGNVRGNELGEVCTNISSRDWMFKNKDQVRYPESNRGNGEQWEKERGVGHPIPVSAAGNRAQGEYQDGNKFCMGASDHSVTTLMC